MGYLRPFGNRHEASCLSHRHYVHFRFGRSNPGPNRQAVKTRISPNWNFYELASQNIIVKIIEPSGGVTSTNFSERMGQEMAQVIHDAATDGTNRLRYFTGEDSGGFVKAKREMSEPDYLDFMRSRF